MSASGRNGRSRHNRLNTFEILCLILEGVDHGLVPAGPTDAPSFRTIWTEMNGPIERGRWAYAWSFILDEEMVVIDLRAKSARSWRLTGEGKILLRELRLGAFSSLRTISDDREWQVSKSQSSRRFRRPWNTPGP